MSYLSVSEDINTMPPAIIEHFDLDLVLLVPAI